MIKYWKNIIIMLMTIILLMGCVPTEYKKGVDIDRDFPDDILSIYDDSVVYSYEEDDEEITLKAGSSDDVEDVIEYYIELFEDEDDIVITEVDDDDDDEYYAEGLIISEDMIFEIEIEESRGKYEEKLFACQFEIVVIQNKKDKKDAKNTSNDDDNEVSVDIAKEIEPDYITTVIADGETLIGNIDNDDILVSLPEGSFSEDSQVSISMVDKSDCAMPDASRFEVSDKGFDISLVGSDYTRPDGRVDMSFKLTQDMLLELEDEGFLQVAYYFDGEWYLQDIDSLDMDTGIATIGLYHFSWLFPAKLTKEELRNQKAQELAEKDFNDENNLKTITANGKSDLEKIISQATGVKDAKALEAIAEYMLNEKDFSSLMLSGSKGDVTGFSTKMAEMVAKSMSSAAKIGSNATMIAGAFQAAGYLYEGDAKGAAEAVANALLDSTAYGKFIKLSITVVDETIKSWKKNGIEDMYQAYKNGANEGWLGYNVDKEDFEQALGQSSAIERQIRIDALKKHLKITGEKESELSSSEIQEIKQDAVNALKDKFENRLEKEAEIKKNKEYYKNLLDAFEENKVDWSVSLGNELIEGLPYEQRLESYTRVTNKILDMVGGKKIEFDGLVDDNEIPMHVITTALKKWYGEDGEEKVREYLAEKGYIKAVDVNQLAGNWSGTMTYTEVFMDQNVIDSIIADLPETSEDGCDQASVKVAMEEQKALEGTSESVSFLVSVSGNTVSMTSTQGDDISAMTFSYDEKSGVLTLISGGVVDEDFTFSTSFRVINSTSPTISGTMVSSSNEMSQDGITVEAGAFKTTISLVLNKD